MQATFVDVQNEIRDIRREADHLDQLLTRLGDLPLPGDSQTAWEVAHVCASAVEKIYTGFERVMARIASEVDRAPVAHTEFWHASLLKRMANSFPDVRPAVISEDLCRGLDRLRAFRHRERNTYGADLDLDIVIERGREAVLLVNRFEHEVRLFFEQGYGTEPSA